VIGDLCGIMVIEEVYAAQCVCGHEDVRTVRLHPGGPWRTVCFPDDDGAGCGAKTEECISAASSLSTWNKGDMAS
jgi:hypothetical protein